jgi:uncharacterized membrane protein
VGQATADARCVPDRSCPAKMICATAAIDRAIGPRTGRVGDLLSVAGLVVLLVARRILGSLGIAVDGLVRELVIGVGGFGLVRRSLELVDGGLVDGW